MDRTRAVLKAAPVFSAVDDATIDEVLRQCPTRRCAAGASIFAASAPAEQFYLILEGRVKVFHLSPRGEEQILHLYGPGETFGEAAMWAGGTYPAHAQAVTDARLLVVRRDALRRQVARRPELAFGMLAGLSAKLREFAALIEGLSLKDVPQRLAGVLLSEARRAGADAFRLRQTKRQLAAQIGTAAETLSRALSRLRDAGLIDVRGRQITLRDRPGLEELAGGTAPAPDRPTERPSHERRRRKKE